MNLKDYARRKHISNKNNKENWRIKKLSGDLLKDMTVLDVGCANGAVSGVVRAKDAKYHGLDYNETFVNDCKKKGLAVKKCDVAKEKMPYADNTFDAIYCAHILEHMGSYEQIHFVKECSRVLKKRGRLYIFSPTPYNPYFWEDETHVRPCTHGHLANLVKNFDLQVIESKYAATRLFSNASQRYLRLPPLKFFLWEVYIIAEKK